jgi:hypothetical protein
MNDMSISRERGQKLDAADLSDVHNPPEPSAMDIAPFTRRDRDNSLMGHLWGSRITAVDCVQPPMSRHDRLTTTHFPPRNFP